MFGRANRTLSKTNPAERLNIPSDRNAFSDSCIDERLRRHYSRRGWRNIIERAESALALRPGARPGSTASAQQIQIPTPVRIGHLD
ncbi:hypothetical protein [Nocardia sp. NPDC051463]|uniref:hypothetical protein n=1 Tax=Nocardia sp. NPDC051463 TaxID=3154845 RepID=UPI00344B3E61